MESKKEIGIETIPCASGWCGKIVESEDVAKEGELFFFNAIKRHRLVIRKLNLQVLLLIELISRREPCHL